MPNLPAGNVPDRDEIDERVAILRRLRRLLEDQRAKFREYLTVLEKQQEDIRSDDTDAMASHAELEQHIISNIYTLQKVIDPMEAMYHSVYPSAGENIPRLKAELSVLQRQVLAQNEKNRELLKSHMTELRRQISTLKNPYAKRSGIYSNSDQSAGIIDIMQ